MRLELFVRLAQLSLELPLLPVREPLHLHPEINYWINKRLQENTRLLLLRHSVWQDSASSDWGDGRGGEAVRLLRDLLHLQSLGWLRFDQLVSLSHWLGSSLFISVTGQARASRSWWTTLTSDGLRGLGSSQHCVWWFCSGWSIHAASAPTRKCETERRRSKTCTDLSFYFKFQ